MSIGIACAAEPFALAIDCLSPLSESTVQQFVGRGVKTFGRYLENLTAAEVDAIHRNGGSIIPITEAVIGPLSDAFGVQCGQRDVDRAQKLDMPDTVQIWVDDEAARGSVPDVTGYLMAVSKTIVSANFGCGGYIGAGQPLSGHQLYLLPYFHGYWRGGSLAIPEPDCSFMIWQLPRLDRTAFGQRVDYDAVSEDFRGRVPMVWSPA